MTIIRYQSVYDNNVIIFQVNGDRGMMENAYVEASFSAPDKHARPRKAFNPFKGKKKGGETRLYTAINIFISYYLQPQSQDS